jgi:hypothetical protein
VTALARPRRNCMESQLRQQNKAVSSAGLRPKSDCSGKVQKQLYSNLQTRPLVREGATKLQTCNGLNEISRRKQTLVNCPRLGSTPRHTDWLTVSRNVTLTLTLTLSIVSLGAERKRVVIIRFFETKFKCKSMFLDVTFYTTLLWR